MKRIIPFLVFSLLIIFSAVEVYAAKTVYITQKTKVYKSRSEDSKTVGSLKEGQEVRVSNEPTEGWYKVKVNNKVGWVNEEFISEDAPNTEDEELANDEENMEDEEDMPKKKKSSSKSSSSQGPLSKKIDFSLGLGYSLLFAGADVAASKNGGIGFGGDFYYPVAKNMKVGLDVSYQTLTAFTAESLTAAENDTTTDSSSNSNISTSQNKLTVIKKNLTTDSTTTVTDISLKIKAIPIIAMVKYYVTPTIYINGGLGYSIFKASLTATTTDTNLQTLFDTMSTTLGGCFSGALGGGVSVPLSKSITLDPKLKFTYFFSSGTAYGTIMPMLNFTYYF